MMSHFVVITLISLEVAVALAAAAAFVPGGPYWTPLILTVGAVYGIGVIFLSITIILRNPLISQVIWLTLRRYTRLDISERKLLKDRDAITEVGKWLDDNISYPVYTYPALKWSDVGTDHLQLILFFKDKNDALLFKLRFG